MFFEQNRDQMRRYYVESWRKARAGEALEPVERMIADVVADHPEYHALLENEDKALGREYLPEDGDTNPFLHMGMHIAIREQVATDRPQGVRHVHQRLTERRGSAVEAEHAMIECLAEMLWRAQRDNAMPDEAGYLDCLKGLLGR